MSSLDILITLLCVSISDYLSPHQVGVHPGGKKLARAPAITRSVRGNALFDKVYQSLNGIYGMTSCRGRGAHDSARCARREKRASDWAALGQYGSTQPIIRRAKASRYIATHSRHVIETIQNTLSEDQFLPDNFIKILRKTIEKVYTKNSIRFLNIIAIRKCYCNLRGMKEILKKKNLIRSNDIIIALITFL